MRYLKIRDPIPVQAGVDIKHLPYQFEYHWTNLDKTFINFHDSYLLLRVKTSLMGLDTQEGYSVCPFLPGSGSFSGYNRNSNSEINVDEAKSFYVNLLEQNTNIYAVIDSVDIEMVYELPDGSEKALQIREPCMHATRGRKMVALKEQSTHDLDKSIYGEDLSTPREDLRSLAFVLVNAGKEVEIVIPLYLICGLGMDPNNLVYVKQLKMLFRTSTIDSLIKNTITDMEFPAYDVDAVEGDDPTTVYHWKSFNEGEEFEWFDDFKIISADMVLATCQYTYTDANKLTNVVPSYVQLDYQYGPIKQETFLVNRALSFLPEYILFWFTKEFDPVRIENVPCTGIWPVYLSCIIGNMQMFPQTNFPSSIYAHNLRLPNKYLYLNEHDTYCPNHMLYNLWADHSNSESKLDYNKWLKHPVYVIPCNALMDVQMNTGVEMNFEMRVELHDIKKISHDAATFAPGAIVNNRNTGEITGVYGTPHLLCNPRPDYLSYAINKFREIYTVKDANIIFDSVYTLHMLAVRRMQDN